MMGLVACSHENPLQTQPEEEMVNFLRDSSEYAAKKIKYKDSWRWGDVYLYCMEGHLNKDPDFCPKLYSYMIEYAEQPGSKFTDLTVDDLTDKNVFDHRIKKSAYFFNSMSFS